MNQSCAFQTCGEVEFKHGLCKGHYAAIARDAFQEARANGRPAAPPLLKTAMYVFNRLTDSLIDGYRRAFELGHQDLLSIHLSEVEQKLRKGSIDGAAASLRQAADLAPENPRISLHLGELHMSQGEPEKALCCFQSVLDADPSSETVHQKVADALLALQRYDEAAKHLSAAIEIAPDRPELHNALGAALEAAGRTDEAIAAYEAATRAAPDDPRFLQALGFAHEALGEHEAALGCFKRALELER